MTVATPSMSLPVERSTATARPWKPHASPVRRWGSTCARRLAAAISRGDESRLPGALRRYETGCSAWPWCWHGSDETLAQDAVQAAFIIAARKLRGAESAGHLWNWLARVTRQQLVKIWRQRSPATGLVEVGELPDCPSEPPPDAALEECLDAALLTMPPDDRDLIAWFYFERLSHKEIADRLGATPKAVSSRLERLRAKLRSAIARQLSHEA